MQGYAASNSCSSTKEQTATHIQNFGGRQNLKAPVILPVTDKRFERDAIALKLRLELKFELPEMDSAEDSVVPRQRGTAEPSLNAPRSERLVSRVSSASSDTAFPSRAKFEIDSPLPKMRAKDLSDASLDRNNEPTILVVEPIRIVLNIEAEQPILTKLASDDLRML
jgi:hypothetical protein